MKIDRLLRIAVWEVTHQTQSVNRRTVLVILLAFSLAGGVLVVSDTSPRVSNQGLYTVGVQQTSSYAPVVESSPALVPVEASQTSLQTARTDVLVSPDGGVQFNERDAQSRAALATLVQDVESYNRQSLSTQGHTTAAYPVLANVTYQEQLGGQGLISQGVNSQQEANPATTSPDSQQTDEEGTQNGSSDSTDTSDQTDSTDTSDQTDSTDTSDQTDSTDTSDQTDSTDTSDQTDSTDTSDQTDSTDTSDPTDSTDTSDSIEPSPEPADSETVRNEVKENTPDGVAPRFPFRSVLLGFLFILPMNFVVQTFASSVIDERLDYSGELLLVTPTSRYSIVLGKMLPYLGVLLATTTGLSILLGASVASVYAIMSFAFAFLSAGFLAGIFSRSYKELTFVFLTMSILLVSFILIPSIFTSIHPIAIISPLTVVVTELNGETLPLVELIFATAPMLLSGIVMVVYGVGIYKEEDLFAQRPVPQKMLDMLGQQIRSWKSLFWIDMTILPFVFAAELLLVAGLFVVPRQLSAVALLAAVALIEEVAKSLAVYAGVQTGRLTSLKQSVYAGLIGGLGFFFIEKVTVIVQVIGLLELQLGNITFGPAVSSVVGTPFAYAIPVFWIAIHPVTTAISSVGARYGKRAYVLTLLLAATVHFLYNGVILYA